MSTQMNHLMIKKHLNEIIVLSTHSRLELIRSMFGKFQEFLLDFGKQCRPRSDATFALSDQS